MLYFTVEIRAHKYTTVQHTAQYICTYIIQAYVWNLLVYFSLLKPEAISRAVSMVYLPGLPIDQQRALLFP